jgi:hypothetical protein
MRSAAIGSSWRSGFESINAEWGLVRSVDVMVFDFDLELAILEKECANPRDPPQVFPRILNLLVISNNLFKKSC